MYLVDDTGIDITSGNAELYQLNTDKCGTLKVQGEVSGGNAGPSIDYVSTQNYGAMTTNSGIGNSVGYLFEKATGIKVKTVTPTSQTLIREITTHAPYYVTGLCCNDTHVGMRKTINTTYFYSITDGSFVKSLTHANAISSMSANYIFNDGVIYKFSDLSVVGSIFYNNFTFLSETIGGDIIVIDMPNPLIRVRVLNKTTLSEISSNTIARLSTFGGVFATRINERYLIFEERLSTPARALATIYDVDENVFVDSIERTTDFSLYQANIIDNSTQRYYITGSRSGNYEQLNYTFSTVPQIPSLTLTAYNREVYITKQIEVTDGVLSDSLSIPETMRGLFTFYVGNQSDFSVTINNLKVHYNRVPVLLDIDNRRPVAGDYIYIKCINSSSVDSIFFGVTEATEYSVVISTPDTEIIGVRVPPATPGRCSVYLQSIDGDSNAIDIVMQASHASAMSDRCTQYTELAYTQSVTDLYPSGQSIAKYEGSNFWKLNRVIAHMAKLIEGQVCSILKNSSPITADVSIPEWTEEYNSDCMTPSQIALFRPGSNDGVFYDMAARLGLDIDIKQTTVALANCIGKCTQSVWSQSVLYTWIIYVYGLSPIRANCIGKCTQKLSFYDSKEIECIFNKYKPAHTQLSIIYVSEGRVVDENGDGIIDENGNNIAYFV